MTRKPFIIADCLSHGRTRQAADIGRSGQFAARLKTKADFVPDAARDPAILGDASHGGEPHPGCSANNIEDRRNRLYAGNRGDILFKAFPHGGGQ